MCKPRVSLNDKIHSAAVWAEPDAYPTVIEYLEGQGAQCQIQDSVPGFVVICIRNSVGTTFDKNNIRILLEDHEAFDFIPFDDAMSIRDQILAMRQH